VVLFIATFVISTLAVPALNIDRSRRRFTGSDINLIRDGIYVGDQYAAGDIDDLIKLYNISAILNVAWDLDIRYPEQEYEGSFEDDNEHIIIQYAKVGLVDATGNSLSTLASAVFALDQFFQPRVLQPKDQPTYPQPVSNVLVHCHSGQSRSVTVASLYIYFKYHEDYPTYQDALLFVKRQRGLLNNSKVPEPNITALAEQLAKLNMFGMFNKSI